MIMIWTKNMYDINTASLISKRYNIACTCKNNCRKKYMKICRRLPLFKIITRREGGGLNIQKYISDWHGLRLRLSNCFATLLPDKITEESVLRHVWVLSRLPSHSLLSGVDQVTGPSWDTNTRRLSLFTLHHIFASPVVANDTGRVVLTHSKLS